MKDMVTGREEGKEGKEKQPGVQVIGATLREGESFSGFFFMREGSPYAVTIEEWKNIDAIVMSLSDASGGIVRPEIDETATAVFFIPPRNGLYELTIVLSALAKGAASADVRAAAREMRRSPNDQPSALWMSVRRPRSGHLCRAERGRYPRPKCFLEGPGYGTQPLVWKPSHTW